MMYGHDLLFSSSLIQEVYNNYSSLCKAFVICYSSGLAILK